MFINRFFYKYFLFLFLTLVSFNSFSDTYLKIASSYAFTSGPCGALNITSSTIAGLCPQITPLTCFSATAVSEPSTDGTLCRIKEPGVSGYVYNNRIPTVVYSCPGGGTISGSNCINAPSCSIGVTRNPATGLCGTDECPPIGTTSIIGVKQSDTLSSPPGKLVIEINQYSDTAYKSVKNGAEYSYSISDYAGTCTTETDGIYCNYSAVSTGVCSLTSSNAKAPGTGPISTKTSSSGKCTTDSLGNTLCSSNPVSNRKCGTVNAVQVCIDSTAGTGTVNGLPYQVSDKNCGLVNGSPVCVSNDASSATTKGCFRNGGVVQCVNSDLVKDRQTTTVANPDGSTTTTTSTESNLIGSGTDSTSTTIDGDGNASTTSVSDGVTDGTETGEVNCDKYPTSLGCISKGSESDFEPDLPTTHVQVPITTSVVEGFGSSGSCPGGSSFSAFGKSYTMSWAPLCTFASQMKPVILAVSSVVALFIIFNAS